jgi:predicted  nucleic acid-binding Zn-ribbon protein
MWLDNIRELRRRTKMSVREISEKTQELSENCTDGSLVLVPEKTIESILAGLVKCPRFNTILPIVYALGGSIDEVFAESGAVVGDKKFSALQEERDAIASDLALARAEIDVLKNTGAALKAENDLLQLKLSHKEEIIAHKEKIIALYSQVDKMHEEHH